MENKAFEITIEVLTNEISRLKNELYFEQCRRELTESQNAKLKEENEHLEYLLNPPVGKGEANE